MPTRESLAERLKRLRKQAGFDRAGFAVASGISIDTIQRIEQGRSKRPRDETIAALAKPLGITPAELLAGTAPEYSLPFDAGGVTRPVSDDPLVDRLRQTFEPDHADVITDWLEETADYTPEDKRFTVQMVEWLRAVMQAASSHRGGSPGQRSPLLLTQK